MPKRGTIRNTGRVARELAEARRERAKRKRRERGASLTPGELGILAAKADARQQSEDPEMPAAPTHDDYAEEAEAAQRAEAWPQAAALWLRACQTCSDANLALEYANKADACNRRPRIDRELEAIAKVNLQIETLATRNSDRLDFHEVSVWGLKRALEAAYEAGRNDAGR